MAYEIEKKFKIPSPVKIVRQLKRAGARRLGGGLEVNWLLDRGLELRRKRTALRLREWCGTGLLTLKGPKKRSGGFVRRLEIQTRVEDAASMRALLKLLGYRAFAQYRKTRDEYRLGGCIVTVDFVPRLKRWFAEIEGDPKQILRVQKRLGLSDSQEEMRSYVEMIFGPVTRMKLK